jgi:uncharacterized ion transporter superfamily protein YfcC
MSNIIIEYLYIIISILVILLFCIAYAMSVNNESNESIYESDVNDNSEIFEKMEGFEDTDPDSQETSNISKIGFVNFGDTEDMEFI